MPSLGFALGIARQHRRADSLDLAWASLDHRLAYTRASSAMFVNQVGLIASAAIGEARFDHHPVSCAPLGLLIEDQRTNLLANSQTLDASPWRLNHAATAANLATAPDGNATADRITPITGASSLPGVVYYIAGLAADGVALAASAFVKGGSGVGWVALRENTSGGTSIAWGSLATGQVGATSSPGSAFGPAANGFFRCSVPIAAMSNSGTPAYILYAADGNGAGSFTADGSQYFHGWGAQLEAGAFPTSYIPTAGDAATRAADACTSSHVDFTTWLARPNKTLVVSADSPASGTRRIFHAAKAGTEANDSISIYTVDDAAKVQVRSGGVTRADLTLGTIAAGTPFTVALSMAENVVEASLNGTARASSASATIPACDKLWFGCGPAGEQLCGHLSGRWQFLPEIGDVEALAR